MNPIEVSRSEVNECVEIETTFEEKDQLENHRMKHLKNGRRKREFNSDLNEKKAIGNC